MTHLLNLTYLAPGIQERILSGELVVSACSLRLVAQTNGWVAQQLALRDTVAA